MAYKTHGAHWIPFVFVALLAGLTYWLLQLSLPAPEASAPLQKAHTPDYFADHFSISVLDPVGTTQYRIKAEKMVHYADNENTEVERPALRAFTPDQPDVTGRAARGVINRDISLVDLYGAARIWRAAGNGEPAMKAASEHFQVLINDDVIQTKEPVKLQRGASRVTAIGMIYNNTTRVMRLTSQVKGVLAASDASASGSL